MCVAAGLTISIVASTARADDAPIEVTTSVSTTPVSSQRRAAAVALAIVPGFFIHGIGAWTVGDKRAAKTLAIGEGIGLTGAGLAGLLVGGSGANPYTTPAIPIVIAGSGMFFQSWFTDIYIAAGGDVTDRPRASAPWSVELGTSWLHDAYRERAMLRGGGRIELGRFDVGAFALADAGGDTNVGQADVRARVLGAAASGEQIDDGTRISVRVGSRWHRDDDDRVTQWTQEIAIDGRLDLDRIERSFGRTFAELGAGVGIVRVKYGDDLAREWSSELLGRFAWGMYLGARGEASLFYEHTRDGLVGGLAAWRASGFFGSVGAAADVRVHGPWAMRAQLEIGNAYLTTIAVSYRGGPR
jgi:hypothetical protein